MTTPFEKVLASQISIADRYYKKWNDKYHVDLLERYYEGDQWADTEGNPYVINLFYSTIEVKLPSLLFNNPVFHITPKPATIAKDPNVAFTTALNLEDALFDWITNKSNNFKEECEAAIFESFFRYGVIEVGYSADWVLNPKAIAPVLESERKENVSLESNKIVQEVPELPVNERLFLRCIPADQFRVSVIDSKQLGQCDWCGYYEYFKTDDLKNNKNLKNRDRLKAGYSPSSSDLATSSKEEFLQELNLSKVWKLYFLKERKLYIFSESDQVLLGEEEYDFFPFLELRFKKRRKGFYPFPFTRNWVWPQNEINEVREANRTHRRRFKRIYEVLESVDEDELLKAINGPDGSFIKVPQRESIRAIENADLGASSSISMAVTKDDFNIISGTTSEMRGQADVTTATQATITNQRAGIRENNERIKTANFLIDVAEKLIEVIQKKLVNTLNVDLRTNPNRNLQESQVQELNPLTDFGEQEDQFEATIQIDTMSPVANEVELNKFLQFIALLTQYPHFSLDPDLVRELAFRTGYRNERVIQKFMQMAQLQMVGMLEQGIQGAGGGNMAQNTVAQATPPNAEQVRNQLQQQVGL